MKLKLSSRSFKQAVSQLTNIYSATTFKDPTTVVVLSTGKQSLIMESVSSGFYIRVKVEAEVGDSGKAVVALSYLSGLVLNGKETEIEFSKKELYFKSGNFKGFIMVSNDPVEKFEEEIKLIKKPAVQISVKNKWLQNSLNTVTFDPTVALKFYTREKKLVLSQMNTFYGSLIFGEFDKMDSTKNFKITAPSKFMSAVIKSNKNEIIEVGSDDVSCFFKTPVFEVCHPMMAIDASVDSDVDIWIDETTRSEKTETVIVVEKKNILSAVESVSNIISHAFGASYDTKVSFIIKENNVVKASLNSAISRMTSVFKTESIVGKKPFDLSASNTLDFIKRMDNGPLELNVYSAFILMKNEKVQFIIPKIGDE